VLVVLGEGGLGRLVGGLGQIGRSRAETIRVAMYTVQNPDQRRHDAGLALADEAGPDQQGSARGG
jgi:prephenate dehydrogenase